MTSANISDNWTPSPYGAKFMQCPISFLLSGLPLPYTTQCGRHLRMAPNSSLFLSAFAVRPSLTFTGELVSRASDLHLDAPPPLGVLAAAEVRHRLLAFLVHVHITGCGREIERGG